MKKLIILFITLFLTTGLSASQYFGNSTINNASQNLIEDTYDNYQIIPYYGKILKGKTFVLGMDDNFVGDVLNLGASWQLNFGTPILLLQYDANGSSSTEDYGESDINSKLVSASDFTTDPDKSNNDSYKIGLGFGKMFGEILGGLSYALIINNNSSEYKKENTVTDKSNGASLYKKQFISQNSISDKGSLSHIITLGTKIGMFLPQLQVVLSSENGDNADNASTTINEIYNQSLTAASNLVTMRRTIEGKGINVGSGSSISGRNLKNISISFEGMLKLDMMKSMNMEPEIVVGFQTRSLNADNAKYEFSILNEHFVPGTTRFSSSTNSVDSYSYEKDSDSTIFIKARTRKYFDITKDSQVIFGPSYSLYLDSYKYKSTYTKRVETKVDNNTNGTYTDAGDVNTVDVYSGNNDWVDNSTTTHTISLPIAVTVKPAKSLKLFVSTRIDYTITTTKKDYEDVQGFTAQNHTDINNSANNTNIKQSTYTETDSTQTTTTSLNKYFALGLSWMFADNYALNARAYNDNNKLDIRYWTLDITGRF